MKDSHFRTPRTMNEAQWQPEGQAIFQPEEMDSSPYSWLLLALVIVFVGVLIAQFIPL